ncbi:MAG: hypothetical protein JNM89_04975 [Hyphomicrobiaceae bacterium]|nr:hypothetical protein [Hyphomicrobiaceae bacterium]
MGVPWTALTGGIFGVLVAGCIVAVTSPPTGRIIQSWEIALMILALLFSGAFLVIGFGLLGAPFWVWWKSRQTVFVLTDKRLMRIFYGHSREVVSFDPATFVSLQRRGGDRGAGTLTIVTGYAKDSDGDTVTNSEQIVGVQDVAQVERLIRAMMRVEKVAVSTAR